MPQQTICKHPLLQDRILKSRTLKNIRILKFNNAKREQSNAYEQQLAKTLMKRAIWALIKNKIFHLRVGFFASRHIEQNH